MGAPNWGRLFIEGRCKAIGIPFSNEEVEAIKSGVNPKSIQNGEWKSKEVKIVETKKEIIEQLPVEQLTGDEKEVKKQLKQTLRDKGISFTNFDTIEKLQEKLSANI